LQPIDHTRGVIPVFLRVLLRNPGGHAFHVRVGLGQRHAWLEPGVSEVVEYIPLSVGALRIDWHPNVVSEFSAIQTGYRKSKPRGHDTGHRVLLPVHGEGPSDDLRIAAQAVPERA